MMMRLTLLLLCGAVLHAAEIRAIVLTEPATAVRSEGVNAVAAATRQGTLRCTPNAAFRLADLTDRSGAYVCAPAPASVPAAMPAGLPGAVRQHAQSGARRAAATAEGLFVYEGGQWRALTPSAGKRSWALTDVRGTAFASDGALWFASPQGVGRMSATGQWQLWAAEDGLPYDDFTTMAAAPGGSVWFGTHRGAIHFDGKTWEYRQGRRWLAGDDVRSIAVLPNGDAWFATDGGVSVIERRAVRLAEKARFFEAEIDKRHRRTPYQYVLGVTLARPGDKSEWTQHDSDNDGLWTSMYGAGQCFAYAATKDPLAKQRAKKAFEAMEFLRTVTQGGEHPAPPGFVARSILPVSQGDPNATHYTPERDRQTRDTKDKLWKVIAPRWPKSADGQWYWKTDTSSDELDGHFFFYALYYDLVAATEEERRPVRAQVAAIADHLLAHNYNLVDHDGKPTRWSIFDPQSMNQNKEWWQERGMNSLSILAYLKVAAHMTGGAKYEQAIQKLIREHGYSMNVLSPKTHLGAGAGNQSDDEMVFMNFFTLLRYEKDPDLMQKYALAFYNAWQNEEPELSPLFHYLAAATTTGKTFSHSGGTEDLSPSGPWQAESLDTLRRYPLDRVNWGQQNSHRTDIVPLSRFARDGSPRARGARNNGRVLPVDERVLEHWNHDPWALDTGGNGRNLSDGNSFLLPYYMGLYFGYIPAGE